MASNMIGNNNPADFAALAVIKTEKREERQWMEVITTSRHRATGKSGK